MIQYLLECEIRRAVWLRRRFLNLTPALLRREGSRHPGAPLEAPECADRNLGPRNPIRGVRVDADEALEAWGVAGGREDTRFQNLAVGEQWTLCRQSWHLQVRCERRWVTRCADAGIPQRGYRITRAQESGVRSVEGATRGVPSNATTSP